MARASKNTLIKRRVKELIGIYEPIVGDKITVVKPVIQQVANMEYYIENLTNELDKVGFVEEYQNGSNQFGKKESTESKAYSTMIKNYTASIKTLISILPEEQQAEADDGFEEFLERHKR